MQIIFPLLVDDTISTNILPGLCKVLERYCIIYKTDELLKWGGLPADSKIISIGLDIVDDYMPKVISRTVKSIAGGTPVQESDENQDKADYERLRAKYGEREIKYKEYEKQRKEFEEDEYKKYRFLQTKYGEKDKREKDREMRLSSVDIRSNLSIEPTIMTIATKKGTVLIGVKVIPYPIGAEKFVRQLTIDNSLSIFDRFLARYERSMTRMFYTLVRKLPYFKNISLEQDPFKDIIYARSKFKGNVFCLLNLNSLENDDMFMNAGGVDRLFRLGWNSVIITDDITKRIVFCMKEQGGLCSISHYSFLYSALGRDASDVYQKLEDLRKSTSPLFSKKINPSRFFGESLSNKFKDRFSNIGLPCIKKDCK